MKRQNKINAVVSLCAFLFFASCTNLTDGTSSQNNNQSASENFGSIRASVCLNGALPPQIPALIPENISEENTSSRSAFAVAPVLTTSGYTLTITATNTKDSSDTRSINTTDNADCFSEDRLSYTISGLKINSSYKITASVTDGSGTEILKGTSRSFTLTQTNSVCADADVALGPLSNGNGDVNLTVNVDTSLVKSIKLKLKNNTENWTDDAETIINVTSSTVTIIDKEAVPSGSYNFEIKFYSANDGEGAVQYSTTQTINVFDGLITNRWVNNSNEKEIADGELSVTAAIIADFNKLVDFFVKSNGNDENTGTWLKPLATVGAALSRMTDSGADYTITIQDDLTGTYVLEMPATSRANSITIRGEGTVKLDGNGNETNPVLKINTPSDIPVTIENLTITGGKAEWGSGLYIEGQSQVTLGNRAVITGNKNGAGAGAYVHGTNATTYPVLTILAGAKINGNTDSGAGCGICVLNYGQVIMNGGELSDNSCATANGGSVHLYNYGKFTMNGGTISGNSAARGAAVYINPNCTFTMNGGTISGNSTRGEGGAVYVGGTFNIKGDASIPYGVTNESGVLVKGAGKNDVYLAAEKFITVIDDLSQDVVAAVTTRWKRGDTILSSLDTATLSEEIENKFTLTALADDRWGTYLSSDSKLVTINAPIYVGTKGTLAGNDDDNFGTYTSPFATIARACQEMDDSNTEYIVNVNGTVSGSQTIPASLQAKSIILQGETSNTADMITAVKNGTSEGTTLTVNSTVPVTIKKLTITGGDASLNGGGIYVSAGSVCLSDGAKVTGNKATKYGGGVYVASSAKLFMCGSSLIGDSYTSTTTAIAEATSTNTTPWANKAEQGGGIYNAGAVYIGYSGIDSETNQPVVSAMTDKYGVRRNYASSYGGGIQTQGLTSIKSGYISYNQAATSGGGIWGGTSDSAKPVNINGATICGNKAVNGAGVYVYSGKKISMSSGTIGGGSTSGNVANTATYGGGVDVAANASFEMTGGNISYNTATYGGGVHICPKGSTSYDGKFTLTSGDVTNNTATSFGGAIYSDGTLELGSTVRIPYGVANSKAVNKNDVYLAGGKTIKVPESLSQHNSSLPISVIPEKPAKHLALLSGSNLTSVYASFNYPGKGFVIKNTGKLELKNIVEEIYVSPTGSDPSGNTKDDSTWNQNPYALNAKSYNDSTTYSQQYPFKTIDMALKFITYQDSADTTYTIRIQKARNSSTAPILTGAQTIANNSDSNNPITLSSTVDGSVVLHAKKIILRPQETEATLSGGNSARPLTINTPVPVELQWLDITAGSATNGGGIYVDTGSTLILGTGAKVYGNTASTSGGGIYNAGTLIVKSSAIIGVDGTYSEPPASTGGSNAAFLSGGGIYTTGAVWFGYTEAKTDKTDSSFSGKIIYNRAANWGGGVYVADGGKFYMSNGQISYNCTVTSNSSCGGAGVYIASSSYSSRGNFYMYGGSMTKNWHHGTYGHGGAVFITANTWLTMSGSASIPYESTNKSDVYTAKSGESYGYISVGGTLTASGTAATVTPDIFNIGRDIALCSSSSYRASAKNKIALAQTGDNFSGRYKTEINGNGVEIQLDLSKVTNKSWITSYMQDKSYNTSPNVLYTFEYETTKTFILKDNNWGGIAVVTVSCTYFNNREDDGDCSAEFTITTKSIEGTNTVLEQNSVYYDFDFSWTGNDEEKFLYYGVVADVSDIADSSFYLSKTGYDTIELTQGGNVEWYLLP